MMVGLGAGAKTGDVNLDGEVNITDVNAVIDAILSGGANTAADVNQDGEVNISDINIVIDIILGGGDEDELTPREINLDYSALTEPAESIPDDEDAVDYGDYVENTVWVTTVNIAFNGRRQCGRRPRDDHQRGQARALYRDRHHCQRIDQVL